MVDVLQAPAKSQVSGNKGNTMDTTLISKCPKCGRNIKHHYIKKRIYCGHCDDSFKSQNYDSHSFHDDRNWLKMVQIKCVVCGKVVVYAEGSTLIKCPACKKVFAPTNKGRCVNIW